MDRFEVVWQELPGARQATHVPGTDTVWIDPRKVPPWGQERILALIAHKLLGNDDLAPTARRRLAVIDGGLDTDAPKATGTG